MSTKRRLHRPSHSGHYTGLDYGVDYSIMVYSVAECIARIFQCHVVARLALMLQLPTSPSQITGLKAVTLVLVPSSVSLPQTHQYTNTDWQENPSKSSGEILVESLVVMVPRIKLMESRVQQDSIHTQT